MSGEMQQLGERRDDFVRGAAVLAGAGLLAKVIGAVYRIPIADLLGTEGAGYYGMAYPVYSALTAVSMLGIPTALSQLIASRTGSGDTMGALQLFRTARMALIALGAVLSVLFFVASTPLASFVQASPAALSFQALAPAFLLAGGVSSYRGVLQGFGNMVPTAVSQILEQLGKLGLGLTAAMLVLQAGHNSASAAAASLAGLVCTQAVALCYLYVSYRRTAVRKALKKTPRADLRTQGRDLWATIVMSVPVTAAACAMPLILFLDSLLVSPALQQAGMSQPNAASQVGILTMNVEPLVNMPGALSSALAVSIVPVLAQLMAGRNAAAAADQTGVAFKIAICIALPCAAGYAVFAQPIIHLLFHGLTAEELETAGALLRIMSISTFFLVLIQTISGILQGIGHQMLPLAALCAGAAFKAGLTPILVTNLGTQGAAWASCACFGAACALDLWFLHRKFPTVLQHSTPVGRIVLTTGIMCVAAGLCYWLLGRWSQSIAILCAVLIGAIIYCVLLCRMGCVGEKELAVLPGGDKLVRVLRRLHLLEVS